MVSILRPGQKKQEEKTVSAITYSSDPEMREAIDVSNYAQAELRSMGVEISDLRKLPFSAQQQYFRQRGIDPERGLLLYRAVFSPGEVDLSREVNVYNQKRQAEDLKKMQEEEQRQKSMSNFFSPQQQAAIKTAKSLGIAPTASIGGQTGPMVQGSPQQIFSAVQTGFYHVQPADLSKEPTAAVAGVVLAEQVAQQDQIQIGQPVQEKGFRFGDITKGEMLFMIDGKDIPEYLGLAGPRTAKPGESENQRFARVARERVFIAGGSIYASPLENAASAGSRFFGSTIGAVPNYAKNLIAGAGLAAAAPYIPEAVQNFSLTKEQQAMTGSFQYKEAVAKATSKLEQEQFGYTEVNEKTGERKAVAGKSTTAQQFLQAPSFETGIGLAQGYLLAGAPGLLPLTERSKFKEEFIKNYSGSGTKADKEALAEAAANRVGYGQLGSQLSGEAAANLFAGPFVGKALGLAGPTAGLVKRGAVVGLTTGLAGAPLEVYSQIEGREKATYIPESGIQKAGDYAMGIASASAFGFLTGATLPNAGARKATTGLVYLSDVGEAPGDILTEGLSKTGLVGSFPKVRIQTQTLSQVFGFGGQTVSVSGQSQITPKAQSPSVSILGSSQVPISPSVQESASVLTGIPTNIGSMVNPNINPKTQTQVPIDLGSDVGPPINLPVQPEPNPNNQTETQTNVDTGVPTSVDTLVNVPVGVNTGQGFPLPPIFGFGGGQETSKRKERVFFYDELTTAVNSLFGTGFVQTVEKLEKKKKKKGGKK